MLQRENALSRGRFCEETFTDLLTAMLIPFAGERLQILYPDEPHTGGDIDFIFVNLGTGRRLTVRVQAKRLNQEFEGSLSSRPTAKQAKSGRANDFDRRRYNELLHRVEKGGAYQYQTLTESEGVVPLYAFYNHQEVVLEGRKRNCHPEISGVNLALADRLKPSLDAELRGLKSTPQKRNGFKRMSYIQRWFFGLDTLLCPGDAEELAPTPELIAERLQDLWTADSDLADDRSYGKLSLLQSDDADSSASSSLLDEGMIVSPRVSRPTIRLLSGLPNRDGDTVMREATPNTSTGVVDEPVLPPPAPEPRTRSRRMYDDLDERHGRARASNRE